MGWSRLKLVLASVLLGANILLAYLIGVQAWSSRYIPDEAVQQMKILLERDGITLAEEAFSSKRQSLVIYSGEMGDTYYADTAEFLSKSGVSLSFNTPNGAVFSMENGDRCVFEDGFGIRFEAAGFAAVLESTGFFSPTLAAAELPDGLDPLSSRGERTAMDAVRACTAEEDRPALFEMEEEILWCGLDADTGIVFAACGQGIRDTEIATLSAVFAIQNGQVIGISGEWCFCGVQTTYSAQLYDQVNILYKVKDHILADSTAARKVVTSLSLAYAVYYRADSDQFYFIPTWHVATDEGMTYILNAVNGALYTE